nr:LPD38 domain-containing protein [Silvimonas terrae]
MVDQLAMNPIPQAIRPGLEASYNYDSFRDRAIDSPSQQKLPDADRYGPQTSAGAIALGRALNYSPQRIEHLVSGYFGWLGIQALNVSDLMARPALSLPARPDRDFSQPENMFGIGDFVKSANAGQGKYLQRFYDQQSRLDQVYATYSDARKVGDIEKAQELASGNEMRQRVVYNSIGRNIERLTLQGKRITNDPNLSPAEKREALSQINLNRNRLAQMADGYGRRPVP